MAASSTDFKWFNDVDDEHSIGKGPTTSSMATSSSPQTLITTTPASSVGPFDRVRQLCGQSKLPFRTTSTGHTSSPAVDKAWCNNPWKRPHSHDENGSVQKSSMSKAPAQKKKKTVIPAHVKLQTDNADSASHSSGDDNDNDNDNLSINDKCVGLSCIIRLSTDSYTPETYEKSLYL